MCVCSLLQNKLDICLSLSVTLNNVFYLNVAILYHLNKNKSLCMLLSVGSYLSNQHTQYVKTIIRINALYKKMYLIKYIR